MRPSETPCRRRSTCEERPSRPPHGPTRSHVLKASRSPGEWDACQLRGQLGLAQQDLARVCNDLTTALAQAHTPVADLDDRLKASVAAEREASARSNQQATSLAELSARFQQQLDCCALVPTMSASVSLYASVSGQRRRSTL